MHLARRCAWCRTYQTVFRIASPVLPYTEPRILEHAERAPARPLSALAVARPWTVPRAWEHASRSQTSPSTRYAVCCASTVSCRCLLRFPLPPAREAKSRSRRLSPMTRRTTSTPLTTLCLSRALRCTTPSSRGLPASITGQTGMGALTHAVEAFIDWVDRMNAALDIPNICDGHSPLRHSRDGGACRCRGQSAVPRSTFDGPFGADAHVRGRRGWYV